MIGLNIPHWCPITDGDGLKTLAEATIGSSTLEEHDGIVTSMFFRNYVESFLAKFPDAYYFYTKRNEDQRRASLNNIAPRHSVYQYAEQETFLYLKENAKRLAILDLELEDSEKWTIICDFLGLDQPNDAYPYKNASGLNYVI